MDLSKFVSRKLFLAVGAIVTAISNKDYTAAAGIAIAYLVAQGFVDAVAARKVTVKVNAAVDSAQAAVEAAEKAGGV